MATLDPRQDKKRKQEAEDKSPGQFDQRPKDGGPRGVRGFPRRVINRVVGAQASKRKDYERRHETLGKKVVGVTPTVLEKQAAAAQQGPRGVSTATGHAGTRVVGAGGRIEDVAIKDRRGVELVQEFHRGKAEREREAGRKRQEQKANSIGFIDTFPPDVAPVMNCPIPASDENHVQVTTGDWVLKWAFSYSL